MSWLEPDEPEAVTRYSGNPNSSRAPKEPGRWKQFLLVFIPWLSRKGAQADEMLAVKVQQAKAEAFKTYAEGLRTIAEAKKFAAEAAHLTAKLDEQNSKRVTAIRGCDGMGPRILEEQLSEEFHDLEQKLTEARWRYGLRIAVALQDSEDNEMHGRPSSESDKTHSPEFINFPNLTAGLWWEPGYSWKRPKTLTALLADTEFFRLAQERPPPKEGHIWLVIGPRKGAIFDRSKLREMVTEWIERMAEIEFPIDEVLESDEFLMLGVKRSIHRVGPFLDDLAGFINAQGEGPLQAVVVSRPEQEHSWPGIPVGI